MSHDKDPFESWPEDKDPLNPLKLEYGLKYSEEPISERERKKQICLECDRIRYISRWKRPQCAECGCLLDLKWLLTPLGFDCPLKKW